MPLTTALRMVAAVLIIASALQFFFYNQLLIKTIVVAHVLFLLSMFSDRYTHRIAVISLGLALVAPIGAWKTLATETATPGFFIINLLVFLYLAYIAYQTLKKDS